MSMAINDWKTIRQFTYNWQDTISEQSGPINTYPRNSPHCLPSHLGVKSPFVRPYRLILWLGPSSTHLRGDRVWPKGPSIDRFDERPFRTQFVDTLLLALTDRNYRQVLTPRTIINSRVVIVRIFELIWRNTLNTRSLRFSSCERFQIGGKWGEESGEEE